MLCQHFAGVAIEDWSSRYGVMKHAPQSVEIGGVGRRMALRELRRQGVERADGRASARHTHRESQVEQNGALRHVAVVFDADIAQLNVAMQNAETVQIRQRRSDLRPHPSQRVGAQWLLRHQSIEVGAGDPRKDEIAPSVEGRAMVK